MNLNTFTMSRKSRACFVSWVSSTSKLIVAMLVFTSTCLAQGEQQTATPAASKSGQADDKGTESKSEKPADDTETPKTTKHRSLFDGKSLAGWESTNFGGEGEVYVEDGQIIMDYGTPLTGVNFTGKVPTSNYEISLEAMQVDGFDFFCGLTFPVNDSFCTFVVAGWAGAVVGLSNIDDRDASENETTKYMTFKEDTWYKVRVRVEPKKITCWIDDEKVVDQSIEGRRISIRPEVGPSKPLGVSAFETKSALRNIKLRLLKVD